MQKLIYGGGNRVVCSMVCLPAHATVDICISVTHHIYTSGVVHILWEQGSHCISSVHERSGPLLMDTV